MLTFLVSAFAKLRTNALLVTLGLLGLVALAGLSYKAGRSDGYELAQSEYTKSVSQSKDRVIEELRLISDRQIAQQEENRRSNQILSGKINNQFYELAQSVENSLGKEVIVGSDCRADYAGTVGVFNSIAAAASD